MRRAPSQQPIEERLRAAGLPPLPRTAWLEIDLDALVGNLAAIRALVPPGTRLEPVVKADAYGHGAGPVAAALVAAGAEGLCVATFDEALELRAAGITSPILVLFPVPAGFVPDAAGLGIALTAGDGVHLGGLLAAAAGLGDGIPVEIQVEVDTGLGRGGVPPAEATRLAAAVASAPGARLAGLWTHLVAAEDARLSADQAARFEAAVAGLAAGGLDRPALHLAASGGLLTGAGPALDAVRPGLALYGIVPDELAEDLAAAAGLRPVMSLRARPVRVADLPEGHGVGYGPAFRTARPSRIATLPVGYGDGFARTLSHRARALVRGIPVPLVGTIAMDAVMVDVTDVPGPPVTPDDEFVLLGAQGEARIGARELARSRTTNSWEVVAAMARRLPRVYDAASGPVGIRTLAEAGQGNPRSPTPGEQGTRGTDRALER